MKESVARGSGSQETRDTRSGESAGQQWDGSDRSSPGTPAVLRALAHRDFRLFFSGQLISLIGTWMQSVAQSWLVYRLTGSSVLLGLVGFAGQTGRFPVDLAAKRFSG